MPDIDFELIAETAIQATDAVLVRRGASAPNTGALIDAEVFIARANHTGTQAAGTITGLATVATSGSAADLTAGTLPLARIADGTITKAKIENVATATIRGRTTAGTGVPEDLTTAQVRTMINVADGATANSADATLLARANHTGTQLASTVSDFAATVAANAAVALNTAKITNATHTGDATGDTALTLATVNANVGSFGLAGSVAQFTANAKGLITAVVNVAISVAATAISDSTAAGRAFLTAANATAQTALLNVFTSTTKGLVPLSGGGTTTFLRADGTFATPAGGGGSGVTLGAATALPQQLF